MHGEIARLVAWLISSERWTAIDSNPIYPLVTYLPKQLAAKRLLQTV